jgi:hypothetical protein
MQSQFLQSQNHNQNQSQKPTNPIETPLEEVYIVRNDVPLE